MSTKKDETAREHLRAAQAAADVLRQKTPVSYIALVAIDADGAGNITPCLTDPAQAEAGEAAIQLATTIGLLLENIARAERQAGQRPPLLPASKKKGEPCN